MTIDDPRARREITIDGAKIVYAEAGTGDPLVLLHGYPESRLHWRHQFDTLATHYRVIAPDWLGWGESDRPLDLSFRYDDEVERICKFLDAVGASQTAIAAHDYGAHLAVGLVARHPERVTRLALLNSRAHDTFPTAPWLMFAAIAAMARAPLAQKLLEHSPLITTHRLLLRPYVCRGCFDQRVIDRYLGWMGTPAGRKWYVKFFQDYVLQKHPVVEGMKRFTNPVTIIWGDRDPYCPPRVAKELAEIFPNSQLHWLRGANHFVAEERPAEVLQLLQGAR